jgi:hypothetical protein
MRVFLSTVPKDRNSVMTTLPETQVTTRPGDHAKSCVARSAGQRHPVAEHWTGGRNQPALQHSDRAHAGRFGFGHASALYTLLMLVTAITLSFQIITSKFIARNSETVVRAQIYATMLRRAWQVGLGIAVLLAAGSAYLKSYFNLPAQHDLVLLAIAAGVYIPLGVRAEGCRAVTTFAAWPSMWSWRWRLSSRGSALPAFRDGRDRCDDGGAALNRRRLHRR